MTTIKEEIYKIIKEIETSDDLAKIKEKIKDMLVVAKYSDNEDLIFSIYLIYAFMFLENITLNDIKSLISKVKEYFINDDYGAIIVLVRDFIVKKVRE